MAQQLIWIIGGLGALTMIGVFAVFLRRNQGFGPLNLRAVGIVLVGTFAALLAVTGDRGLGSVDVPLNLSLVAGMQYGRATQHDVPPVPPAQIDRLCPELAPVRHMFAIDKRQLS